MARRAIFIDLLKKIQIRLDYLDLFPYLPVSRHGNGMSLGAARKKSPNRQKEVDRVAEREHKPLSFLKNCIQLETTSPKRILAD